MLKALDRDELPPRQAQELLCELIEEAVKRERGKLPASSRGNLTQQAATI
jgi:hypothetical protein